MCQLMFCFAHYNIQFPFLVTAAVFNCLYLTGRKIALIAFNIEKVQQDKLVM